MFKLEKKLTPQDFLTERGEELFQQHKDEIYRNTDKLFARLMVFQWLAGVLAAFIISPYTWDGQSAQIHFHVWAAIFLGGAITIFPVWMTRAWPGAAITRYIIAVAQMLMSALLISLSGGRIETHFHVFGSLVILSFYRDWRVLIPATIVVGLDHFLRGIYWPYSVYGVLTASPWRSLEHAGWVVFEDAFLIISCLRSVREMRAIAHRTSELEAVHHANQLIMDNSQDVICTVDAAGHFTSVSAACHAIFGYQSEELVGQQYISMVHPEDRIRTNQAAADIMGGSAVNDFQNRYIRKDGSLVDVMWSAAWSEADRTMFAVAHDVTERTRTEKAMTRAMEEADRANRAKSEFLSRMSHELRTPMNAILGFAQLLELGELTADQRDAVKHILRGGSHLLDLINEVLDLARIEAGKLSLSTEPVSVDETLWETIELVRPLAAEREVRISPPAASEDFILADRQRLKQVLINLLSNGIKYNRRGGSVTIRWQKMGRFLRLLISDTGIGISEKGMAQLFRPFERLAAAQTTVEGTGLGLAVAKRLVDAMGGKMGVTSAVGEGSTFWIDFNLTQSPLERAQLSEDSLELDEGTSRSRYKVLYIEDNLSNLKLIEGILSRRPGIEIISSGKGETGLQLARQNHPDLILLDLNLPDITGYDVLMRLRDDPGCAPIPVIVISADATPTQIVKLTKAGAADYLTKPLEIRKFINVLDRTLEQTAARS